MSGAIKIERLSKKMKITTLILLPALLFFASCGFFGKSNLSPLNELKRSADGESGTYEIQAGDVLDVQVWGEPKLSGEVIIRDDGNLTMPLVGDIPARGKTALQLSEDITASLVEYVPTASVTVSLLRTAPIKYYLSGKFLKPGEYRSDSEITLLQAIATGGNFQPFADDGNVILIRKSGPKELRYKLDYNRVVAGQEPNPILRTGDVIAVN